MAFHSTILLLTLGVAAACLTTVQNSAAADADAAVADERAIPRDYVTLFPTWQRAFIHEGRLIHAAGEDGIMQALFSTAMDRPRGAESRRLLPFVHLDSESRTPGRPGPSPVNSIHPTVPPLLHCWDVDHDQLMLVFGRMKPRHDFQVRIYSLDSIGGPVREIPGMRALHDKELYPDADINLVHDLQNIGRGQDRFRSTALEDSLEHNPTLHFSIRLLPEQRFEMLVQRLGGWRKDLVETSAGRTREGHIEFLPAYPPEPFFHFTARGQYFLVRQSGPLEMIPDEYLREKNMEDRRTRNTEWQRDDKGQFIVDEQRRGIRLPGEPLNAVADFSKIPDWVASGPETHFMVQDRDAEMVRFFWGVSGYAELEVLEENVPGREDPNNPAPAKAGSLRFEELPAPPEMEDLRAMLLSPPEYERPKVFYLYDPRPHEFLGPQLGLPWRE